MTTDDIKKIVDRYNEFQAGLNYGNRGYRMPVLRECIDKLTAAGFEIVRDENGQIKY